MQFGGICTHQVQVWLMSEIFIKLFFAKHLRNLHLSPGWGSKVEFDQLTKWLQRHHWQMSREKLECSLVEFTFCAHQVKVWPMSGSNLLSWTNSTTFWNGFGFTIDWKLHTLEFEQSYTTQLLSLTESLFKNCFIHNGEKYEKTGLVQIC